MQYILFNYLPKDCNMLEELYDCALLVPKVHERIYIYKSQKKKLG